MLVPSQHLFTNLYIEPCWFLWFISLFYIESPYWSLRYISSPIYISIAMLVASVYPFTISSNRIDMFNASKIRLSRNIEFLETYTITNTKEFSVTNVARRMLEITLSKGAFIMHNKSSTTTSQPSLYHWASREDKIEIKMTVLNIYIDIWNRI